jgi:hypothetical protein
MQVGEGLAFVHSDVKLLHHNICPEVIVVNQQGAWKIFGFDFCVHNHNTQDSRVIFILFFLSTNFEAIFINLINVINIFMLKNAWFLHL